MRHTPRSKGGYEYVLTIDQAEEIRSALTKDLAVYGFDTEYELNDVGKATEELIDKFYVAE
jgi:hypothetical protein